MLESINGTLLGFIRMLNYGECFGERGRIVQSVMVKADLWLLERTVVTAGGGGAGDGISGVLWPSCCSSK